MDSLVNFFLANYCTLFVKNNASGHSLVVTLRIYALMIVVFSVPSSLTCLNAT